MPRILNKRPWLWLLLLAMVAGCAGVGLVDPGPNPARVRVLLDLKTDRSQFTNFDLTTPYTKWQWELYLLDNGRMLPLPTQHGKRSAIVRTPHLVKDKVFLVPPGKVRLRLIVEGWVGVFSGMFYDPITVVSVMDDYDLDLPPGGSAIIRPKKVSYPTRDKAAPTPK